MPDDFDQIVSGIKPTSKRAASADVVAARKLVQAAARRERLCRYTRPYGHQWKTTDTVNDRNIRTVQTACVWCEKVQRYGDTDGHPAAWFVPALFVLALAVFLGWLALFT